MAYRLKDAEGKCCTCEERITPCECAAGPCPGITCRTRGGLAQMLGFPEICQPSQPPRLYLRRAYSGSNLLEQFSTGACSGSPIATASPGFSGAEQYDRTTGAYSSNATFTDGATPISAAECGTFVGCESTLTATRTMASITGRNTCCFVAGTWRKARGSRTQTLSEEDTEQDAINRLLLTPAGAWGAWSGTVGSTSSCAAWWAPRGLDATHFAYQECEIRVNGETAFDPGLAMTAVLRYYRAPYGTTNFQFYGDEEVGFFVDASGRVSEVIAVVPNTKGYITYAVGCGLREGLPS